MKYLLCKRSKYWLKQQLFCNCICFTTYELLEINTRLTHNSSMCKETKLFADFVYSVFIKPWKIRIHRSTNCIVPFKKPLSFIIQPLPLFYHFHHRDRSAVGSFFIFLSKRILRCNNIHLGLSLFVTLLLCCSGTSSE